MPNQVWRTLYQGEAPKGRVRGQFDAVVLAAEEYQPDARTFGVREIIRAPLDDSGKPLTAREAKNILEAASLVAHRVRQGKRVLVTCWMGLNRSGVIVAQALKLLGMSTENAIRHVKRARGQFALSNESFVDFLKSA